MRNSLSLDSSRRGRNLASVHLLVRSVFCLVAAYASLRADVIPPSRLAAGITNGWAVWAGIPGGIPKVETIYTVLTNIDNTGKMDVTGAIQRALDLCPSNQVVLLPKGSFKYNGQLLMRRDGVVLRGSGVKETVLFADAEIGRAHV